MNRRHSKNKSNCAQNLNALTMHFYFHNIIAVAMQLLCIWQAIWQQNVACNTQKPNFSTFWNISTRTVSQSVSHSLLCGLVELGVSKIYWKQINNNNNNSSSSSINNERIKEKKAKRNEWMTERKND